MIAGFDLILRAAAAFKAQQDALPADERAWGPQSLQLLASSLHDAGIEPVEPPADPPTERSTTT